MSSSALTIGVEIEFIFAYNEKEDLGFWQRHNAIKYATDGAGGYSIDPVFPLVHAFANASPPVPLYNALDQVEGRRRLLDTGCGPPNDRWILDCDTSVELTAEEARPPIVPADAYQTGEYKTAGVEIKSPIYDFDADDWTADIAHVLKTLHAAVNDPTNGLSFRALLNRTCGLHVHVGLRAPSSPSSSFSSSASKQRQQKQQQIPFPLPTLKHLITLTTAFERQIDALHTVDRVAPEHAFNAPNAELLRQYARGPTARLCGDSGRLGTHPRDWCRFVAQRVKAVADLERLGFLVHSNNYNFENVVHKRALLVEEDDGGGGHGEKKKKWKKVVRPLGTVEFRQHRGTLDGEEIAAWVAVVAAMVRFAQGMRDDGDDGDDWVDLGADVLEKAYDAHFGADEFLRLVDAGEECVQYYRRARAPEELQKRFLEEHNREKVVSQWFELNAKLSMQRWNDADPAAVRGAIADRIRMGGYGDLRQDGTVEMLLRKYGGR